MSSSAAAFSAAGLSASSSGAVPPPLSSWLPSYLSSGVQELLHPTLEDDIGVASGVPAKRSPRRACCLFFGQATLLPQMHQLVRNLLYCAPHYLSVLSSHGTTVKLFCAVKTERLEHVLIRFYPFRNMVILGGNVPFYGCGGRPV